MLYFHEEVLLLALKDEEGTIHSGSHYTMAMAAALLAELLLGKRIAVDDSKRKLVDCVDPTPVGDPLMDRALERIRTAKRRASLQTWVGRLSNREHLKHGTAKRLCAKGILRAEEDKVLLLFKRRIYPESDPAAERELTGRLERAIFGDSRDVDPRTVVLLSLADAAGLLRHTFDKKELKRRKMRIEQVVNGEMTGKAAKEAIEAIQTAVIVAACIVPVITATTVTTSH